MAVVYRRLEVCACCGSGDLREFLDLGDQPLANALQSEPSITDAVVKFPLKALFCSRCFHVQLSVAVDPAVLYRSYPFLSATVGAFRAHCHREAADILAGLPRRNGRIRVLDVGCNDGLLLEAFRETSSDVDVVGVDPAENIREESRRRGIDVRVAMFEDVAGTIGQFDVITAFNVFAHQADPVAFLRHAALALADGGEVVVEIPATKSIIEQDSFDVFYHEHINYFSSASFSTAAHEAGFHVKRVAKSRIHGGSVRYHLAIYRGEDCEEMLQEIKIEHALGLHEFDSYVNFADRVSRNRSEFLLSTLPSATADGRKSVVFGASAKACVWFHYYGRPKVHYAVDDTPFKQGRYLPGSDVKIRPVETLGREPSPVVFVATAWNYLDESIERIRSVRGSGRGDLLLTYVPDPTVIDL